MKLFKINVKDIVVDHLDNGCFHHLTIVENPHYLSNSIIYTSSKRQLYGVSLSLYHSFVHHKIDECYVIVVPGDYDEKFDLYLNNVNSNMTIYYHVIKKKYADAVDVAECEFDKNQLDLMYCIDLDDDESLDIKMLEEEAVKIKKKFNVTIVLKTLEDNFYIQKFFDTNKNIIDFDYFHKVTTNSSNLFDDFLKEERDDYFYKVNTYPEFIIECSSINEMNAVLDFLKINKDKIKTSRINFKRVERIFK